MILPYDPLMFQKLYRHLEDISNNLCRQELAAGTGGKYDKDILQQLETLTETIKSANLDLQGAIKTPKPGSPVLTIIACAAIAVMVFLGFRLSALTHELVNGQERISRQGEMEIANNRYRLIPDKLQKDAVARIAGLDSIIGQQNRAILELKELNKTAVHTFTRLKYRIDRTDHVVQSLLPDSGHYIGRSQ